MTDIRNEELDESHEEVDAGDHGQDDEPEPQEDVDLLVDDVHAQDAHGVEPLDRSGASKLVEDALGHPGEDPRHRVDPILRGHVGKVQDLESNFIVINHM